MRRRFEGKSGGGGSVGGVKVREQRRGAKERKEGGEREREREFGIRRTESQRMERQYSQQQTRQIAR